MGGWFSSPPVKVEAATQTEETSRSKKTPNGRSPDTYPEDIRHFSPAEIQDMISLYKEKKTAIDRSSIKGVNAMKDHYNSISKHLIPEQTSRPNFDPESLHRKNHPKGYLTKITNDFIAQHDEEISVHKGTMVKVLRNHRDGRYEVYTAGGFGLVPGKVLAYVQYEPDYF